MTEPKRWRVHNDGGVKYHTVLSTVEVVAAADFDRLREERDAYARQVERLDRMVQEMGESRGISELAEARRVAGVLADAHRRIADLPIVDDSDADRMREIAEDALAATPDPPTSWDASNCVRFCDRCDAEYGITAGADVGDTACSGCGAHDASHIYPHRPAASPDERLREALTALVALKDGPRDDNYRAAKDGAWTEARAALAAADREAPDEETTDA